MNNSDVFYIFKGAFFELSPVTVPLCVIVLVQNATIFLYYFKNRAMLVPSLFMGIAFADILKAQGELLLSIVSILVYTNFIEVEVLYKALYYYMATALPGINWSKMFNLALAVSQTKAIICPYNPNSDTERSKKLVACVGFFILMLHISDVIIANIFEAKYFSDKSMFHVIQVLIFQIPGVMTVAGLYCLPAQDQDSSLSRCEDISQVTTDCVLGVVIVLYYVGPPLAVLICMIFEVK